MYEDKYCVFQIHITLRHYFVRRPKKRISASVYVSAFKAFLFSLDAWDVYYQTRTESEYIRTPLFYFWVNQFFFYKNVCTNEYSLIPSTTIE